MSFSINNLLDSAGEFLGITGDPFSTPIGQKVLDATHEQLNSVDWETNLIVVDMVNLTEDGPKEAIRAIRKRMHTVVGKNDQVVYFSLVLLETLAKNCGRKFHLLICSKEFSNELISKIIPASTNAQLVEVKILSLIQSWAHAFSVDPDLQGVAELYLELKKKGVEFPPPTDDDILLVEKTRSQSNSSPALSSSSSSTLSPARNQQSHTGATTQSRPTSSQGSSGVSRPVSRGQTADQQAREARRQEATRRIMAGQLTQHQINKVHADVRKTEDSIGVLSELLSEAIPGQEIAEDKAMLEELAVNCKEMQKRVVQLLQVIENRELMQSLLDCNDNFNNVFIRYERYKRNQPPTKEEQSLQLPVSPSRPTSSDVALLAAGDKDFQEIEEWMKTENLEELEEMRKEFESADALLSSPSKKSGATSPEEGGETTEEFNKFLEKRMEAGKHT